jgi:hypothetical protein
MQRCRLAFAADRASILGVIGRCGDISGVDRA